MLNHHTSSTTKVLTAKTFRSIKVGETVLLVTMPCRVVAKTKFVITLQEPERVQINEKKLFQPAPKEPFTITPGKIFKKTLIAIMTLDKKRREAMPEFTKTMRDGKEVISDYFPTPAQIRKMNPTY